MIPHTYPCTLCTRVDDPSRCENKNCAPWRSWFLSKWTHTRSLFGVSSPNSACSTCLWQGALCDPRCPYRGISGEAGR